MKSLLPKIKAAFPFVGQRPATEKDFYDYCAAERIEVVHTPAAAAGLFIVYGGERFIFLNSGLRGFRLLHVAFHELAHHLLHAPTDRRYAAEFFAVHEDRRKHREAESVAALLLLPMPDLEDLLIDGVYKRDADLADLIGHRLAIAERLGI